MDYSYFYVEIVFHVVSLNLKRTQVPTYNTNKLNIDYVKTPPYPNLAIDNFLPADVTTAMKQECDQLTWTREFTRNGSHMLERNDIEDCPVAREVKNALSSKKFLVWLGQVTGHNDLIPDPHT